MTLDQLRQKVFNGEALSDAELHRLKNALQNREAEGLAAILVQALVNADAIDEALLLVTRLLKDAPRDAQLHLAKARALIAMEKWNEAEPALKQALALHGGSDPEVEKALAVIHLRRGEFERARQTIERLLQADPFDHEAQQLLLELQQLEGATLNSAPDATAAADAFKAALTGALNRRSIAFLLQGDQLLIRSGRSTIARFSLRTLLDEFRTTGRTMEAYADTLTSEMADRGLGVRAGRLHLLSSVLPVLRDDAFLEKAEGAARREGPAGLWVFYVIEDPAFVRYVPQRSLDRSRVTLEELDERAWKNLARKPAPLKPIELVQGALRIAAQSTGLWGLTGNDGHDPARMLATATRAQLEEKLGAVPMRVYLGLRELVLLCRADDEAHAKQLAEMSAADDGINGVFELRNGILNSLSAWAESDVTA